MPVFSSNLVIVFLEWKLAFSVSAYLSFVFATNGLKKKSEEKKEGKHDQAGKRIRDKKFKKRTKTIWANE